jgi:hypothetical protein
MEVSIVTITYGFIMISLGITMLFFYSRYINSDVIRFSHESHKARLLWRLLRAQHTHRLKGSLTE